MQVGGSWHSWSNSRHRWFSMASVAHLRRPDHFGRAGSTRCCGVAVPSQCWAKRVRCWRSPLHHPSNIQNSWYLALVEKRFPPARILGLELVPWVDMLSRGVLGFRALGFLRVRALGFFGFRVWGDSWSRCWVLGSFGLTKVLRSLIPKP